MDSFTQATAHTENLGCFGHRCNQPSISLQARTIQGHSVHVLWFALFCADLLKDWMYVLSIQIHALGRETGRIVP